MRRALAVLLLAGCSASSPGPGSSGPPARVVSLAPSITEIVYALGAGGRLVGVCAQCDQPPEVAGVPRVGGYLTPSVEAVLATQPDLVIAVPSPGNREAVRAVERTGVQVLVVHDRTLAGGVNVAADAGRAWPTLSLELVVARAPEVIVDAAMGSEATGEALFQALPTVPAVRAGRIVRLAGDTLLRAGPRVPDAAAALAAAIHPEAFRPAAAGSTPRAG